MLKTFSRTRCSASPVFNMPVPSPSLRRDSEDDARDTFKTLKNQLLGESNAHLYHAWAALEAQSGNVSRALGILHKGLKEGAQPAG